MHVHVDVFLYSIFFFSKFKISQWRFRWVSVENKQALNHIFVKNIMKKIIKRSLKIVFNRQVI